MTPFTPVGPERPPRFSAGAYGVFYAAHAFETAAIETTYHHARLMAQTDQPLGWTSQFRALCWIPKLPSMSCAAGSRHFCPRWIRMIT